MEPIQIFDNVLYAPQQYREQALSLEYHDIEIDGVTFKGIAPTTDPQLPDFLRSQGVDVTLTFFRKSPEGQREPNYIHTDSVMGDWTAILYLNPHPPVEDGTAFWEHTSTGRDSGDWAQEEIRQLCRDIRNFHQVRVVEAVFGRVVLFRAPLFHSRVLPDNYGRREDARLIQVAFGLERADARL